MTARPSMAPNLARRVATKCSVTRTRPPATGFCPSLPADALMKVQCLAKAREVDGLKLRGKVFNFTTPAVTDIGGASLCIRLEEPQDLDLGTAVALKDGGYLLALRGTGTTPSHFLPAIAGVPCREGLDRQGNSRVALAECMVLARPLVTEEDPTGTGQVTFLDELSLRGWLPMGSTLDVVVLARVTDFFLGLNAGTWLRIRISDIATASWRWLNSVAMPGETGEALSLQSSLELAGLEMSEEVVPPPADASELWHYWGGGGNTGVSGQMTLPRTTPSGTTEEETIPFRFSYKDITLEVCERRRSRTAGVRCGEGATDFTGDLVWPTAVAFCRYLCDVPIVAGARVLDLSAGTGLVGLVASRLDAQSVTLCDVPRVLPLLARNATLASIPNVAKVNGLMPPRVAPTSKVKVRELWWGAAEAQTFLDLEGPFDLILCCEVVYQQPQQVWEALQATLRKLLIPGGRVVFAYQHRDGAEVTDARFFETLEDAAALRFDREESLSDWDGVWDDLDLRKVRTYVARSECNL